MVPAFLHQYLKGLKKEMLEEIPSVTELLDDFNSGVIPTFDLDLHKVHVLNKWKTLFTHALEIRHHKTFIFIAFHVCSKDTT